MKQKIYQFMQGRYGTDQLSRFLMGCAMAAIVLDLFFRKPIFTVITLLLLIVAYYRILSKNVSRRYSENQKYLNYTYKLKNKARQSRQYHIYRCPSCRQKIRIPRGKGRIMVSCPKCHAEFKKKS